MSVINTTALFGTGANASFSYTIQGFNAATNYLFMDFLLIVIFVVVIFMLRNYELRDSLLSSSVIVWILSIVLWISNFVDFARVVVCFFVIIIAILMSYLKE